jgi:hypothetical protein
MLDEDVANDGQDRISHSHAISLLEELLRTKTDPVSETLCFLLLFRKYPDDGQSPKTQYLCVLYTIVRTL